MVKNKQQPIVLAVDIGTTNIRCYAYGRSTNVIGKAEDKIPLLNCENGEQEIEPQVLWLAFQRVVKNCLKCAHLTAKQVSCLGICTQRGTFVTWDRETNTPYHNFISWKDKRAKEKCAMWNTSICMKFFRLGAHLLYWVTGRRKFQVLSVLKFTTAMVLMRLSWVFENIAEVKEKSSRNQALFGTIDTWLVWQLTGGKVHATDGSNACVTGFFDPFKMQWADSILKFFNIPLNILPAVKNSSDSFGETLPEIFGASIPITALVGDQQASMFGACCFEKYDINCTMGTGSFFNINVGCTPIAACPDIYPLVGWTIDSKTTYIAECGVHDFGTIVLWAQNLGLFDQPYESSEIAQSVSDSDGVYFLPALNALETLESKRPNTLAVLGLKTHSSKEHLVRSLLEALAFQVCLLYDVVAERNDIIRGNKTFRICGGVARNDFIVQLISDVINLPLYRIKHNETSSLGAAFLAGLHCGVWKNQDDILSVQKDSDCFLPNAKSREKYRAVYLNWKQAMCHIPSC